VEHNSLSTPEIRLADTSYSHFLPSSTQMADFDAKCIAGGTPGLELMEKAGQKIATCLMENLSSSDDPKITVLCGPGNNGGDGFVIARVLRENSFDVSLVLAGSKKYSVDLKSMALKFKNCGGETLLYAAQETEAENFCSAELLSSREDLENILSGSDMLVEALLGTGQNSAPRGHIKDILSVMTELKRERGHALRIACVDLPAGTNGDSGEVYQDHAQADLTITVEVLKRGMLQYPARQACGGIQAVDIGIDCSTGAEFSILDSQSLPQLPGRAMNSHKGDFGHVLVVGGSRDMPGAPQLAAHAAIRGGAGLVTLCAPESAILEEPVWPEIMHKRMTDNSRGVLDANAFSELEPTLAKASVVLLGPGLGVDSGTGDFVKLLLDYATKKKLPLVLDADALNLISNFDSFAGHGNAILTPHPAEAARLLGVNTADVQKDRYESVKELAKICSGVIVLKGAATIIYDGQSGFVNTSGGPFLATAGSGDVLAGLVAAFMAQERSLLKSACRAVYVHGRAGEEAFRACSGGPIIAGDIIGHLPPLIGKLLHATE